MPRQQMLRHLYAERLMSFIIFAKAMPRAVSRRLLLSLYMPSLARPRGQLVSAANAASGISRVPRIIDYDADIGIIDQISEYWLRDCSRRGRRQAAAASGAQLAERLLVAFRR